MRPLRIAHPRHAIPGNMSFIFGNEPAFFDKIAMKIEGLGEFGVEARDENAFIFSGGDHLMRRMKDACRSPDIDDSGSADINEVLDVVGNGGNDDVFCQNGTYTPGTSDCEAGDWQWGSFTITSVTVEPDVQGMQNFNCSSLSSGQQTQLMDTRDGKMYWVGKLPDGNCWMTQNLDLDLSTGTTLTPANTNILKNWKPSASTTTTISDYYEPDTGKSYDAGNQAYEGTYDPSDPTTAHYLVGNYYQWSAATAGYTGTSQSTQSICPKGWTLPSQSQFQQLINSGLSGSNFMNAPYYLLCGGYLYGSLLYEEGLYGYYWTSTPSGSGYAYSLGFYSGGITVNNYGYRNYGRPVRCVAAG